MNISCAPAPKLQPAVVFGCAHCTPNWLIVLPFVMIMQTNGNNASSPLAVGYKTEQVAQLIRTLTGPQRPIFPVTFRLEETCID